MPIRFLLEEDHAFSPDDVNILVDAFEGTLRALGLTDPEDPSSMKVAKIIVGLAKDGERDPSGTIPVVDAAGLTLKRMADFSAGQGSNRPIPLMETSSGPARNDQKCAVPPKSAAWFLGHAK
jgi:hypothetical protein